MKKISSTDRAALIRLASSLPAGSPEKKALLPLIKNSGAKQASKATEAKFNSILQYLKGDPFESTPGPHPALKEVLSYLLWTWANDLTEFRKWVSLVEEHSKDV